MSDTFHKPTKADKAAADGHRSLGFFEDHPDSKSAGTIAICYFLDALREELAELRRTIRDRV